MWSYFCYRYFISLKKNMQNSWKKSRAPWSPALHAYSRWPTSFAWNFSLTTYLFTSTNQTLIRWCNFSPLQSRYQLREMSRYFRRLFLRIGHTSADTNREQQNYEWYVISVILLLWKFIVFWAPLKCMRYLLIINHNYLLFSSFSMSVYVFY